MTSSIYTEKFLLSTNKSKQSYEHKGIINNFPILLKTKFQPRIEKVSCILYAFCLRYYIFNVIDRICKSHILSNRTGRKPDKVCYIVAWLTKFNYNITTSHTLSREVRKNYKKVFAEKGAVSFILEVDNKLYVKVRVALRG